MSIALPGSARRVLTSCSDSAAVYPAAGTQTASFNNLNQLTNLSGQALTFDAVGNLTSDDGVSA